MASEYSASVVKLHAGYLRQGCVHRARFLRPGRERLRILSPSVELRDLLRASLRRADWPHSLIQTFGDHGLFNRSEFRQAAFHQVAREFLHFQPEELACVQQAIRTTLTAWLLTDRIDRLPAEEQLDALLMARRTLSPDESEPDDVRKAWCQGMARLAQLYRDQYLWDQAWEAAEAWANAAPDGWPLDWLDFWQQVELCRILESGAQYGLVAQIMRPLVETLSRFADTAPDETTLRDLSVACNELGDSEVAEGRREAALEAFRRGLEISERLVEHFGETPQSLRDLFVSLAKVGDVDVAEGRREAALEAFRRGLEISSARWRMLRFRLASLWRSPGRAVPESRHC